MRPSSEKATLEDGPNAPRGQRVLAVPARLASKKCAHWRSLSGKKIVR